MDPKYNENLDAKRYSKRDIIRAVTRAYNAHILEHPEQKGDYEVAEAKAVRSVVVEIGVSVEDCLSDELGLDVSTIEELKAIGVI